LELATEVNLSPTLAVLDKMLSQRIGDRYPSARQVMQAPNRQSSGTHKPPDQLPTLTLKFTFIPTPVNLATGYLHWWGKSAGVPAACQCRWCGLVGSESLATVPL